MPRIKIAVGGSPVVQKPQRRRVASTLLAAFVALLTACAPAPTARHSESDAPAAVRGVRITRVSPTGSEVQGDNWLFVIGIDAYTGWPRLKTAVSDAKAVRDVLLDRYEFDEEHLIQLYDEQATRAAIIEQLRSLAGRVGPDDSLVIYYAGHGHLDSITKKGNWIPVESDARRASAWLSNGDIKDYLSVDAIKAKHILLISDSCFAGDFFRGYRGKLPSATPQVVKLAWGLTSRQVITSGGLRPVSDDGFGGHSVFAHFLLSALQQNEKPFLISSDLFPNLRASVSQNADQLPSFGSLRDTGSQPGGELVLFLKQSARLGDLDADVGERSAELARLRELELALTIAGQQARATEEAEIAKHEKKLAALDADIAAMKQRLGRAAVGPDDRMQTLLAMAKEKKAQRNQIAALKRKRDAEEAKRRAEIEWIEWEKTHRYHAALAKDLSLYQKIADLDSEMGKDAWRKLISKYPELREFEAGDVAGARKNLKLLASGDMVLVPAGVFFSGCNESVDRQCRLTEESGKRSHTSGLWIDRTEVTVHAYATCVFIGGCSEEGLTKYVDCNWGKADRTWHPINCVDQAQAETYCFWADKRLPTEWEWEKAARGTDGRKYPWGNSEPDKSKTNHLELEDGFIFSTAPVGSFPDGASPYGVLDMAGNLQEWTSSKWYSGNVYRGGSWLRGPRDARTSNRRQIQDPALRSYDIGFRCAQ